MMRPVKEKTMRKTLAVALAAAVLALVWAVSVTAQSDMTVVKDPAFTDEQRPPSVFTHDAHNEKAKIDDCVVCHHGGSKGKIVPGESSEGTPCSECHKVAPKDGTTPLREAFHKQCLECHKKSQPKGPTACGGCHTRV